MRLPILPRDKAKTEDVKWPSVTFAQEMAESIAKKRKKRKKDDEEEIG